MRSETVANHFIQRSFDTGVELTPTKLMKLVYIAHGWHRGYFSISLISDAAQAWRYGPAIPALYRKIKHYGRRPIDALIGNGGLPGDGGVGNDWPNDQTEALLRRVWEVYSGCSGVELSAITHQRGTPWDKVRKGSASGNYQGAIIPNDLIELHYKERVASTQHVW